MVWETFSNYCQKTEGCANVSDAIVLQDKIYLAGYSGSQIGRINESQPQGGLFLALNQDGKVLVNRNFYFNETGGNKSLMFRLKGINQYPDGDLILTGDERMSGKLDG